MIPILKLISQIAYDTEIENQHIHNRLHATTLYQLEKSETLGAGKRLTAKLCFTILLYSNYLNLLSPHIEVLHNAPEFSFNSLAQVNFYDDTPLPVEDQLKSMLMLMLFITPIIVLHFDAFLTNEKLLDLVQYFFPSPLPFNEMSTDEIKEKIDIMANSRKQLQLYLTITCTPLFLDWAIAGGQKGQAMILSLIAMNLLSFSEYFIGFSNNRHLRQINALNTAVEDITQDTFSKINFGGTASTLNFAIAYIQINTGDTKEVLSNLEVFELIHNSLAKSGLDIGDYSEEELIIQLLINEKVTNQSLALFKKNVSTTYDTLKTIKQLEKSITVNLLACFHGLLQPYEEPCANNQWYERILNANGTQSIHVYLSCVEKYTNYWTQALEKLQLHSQEFSFTTSQNYLTLNISSEVDYAILKEAFSSLKHEAITWEKTEAYILYGIRRKLINALQGVLIPYKQHSHNNFWFWSDTSKKRVIVFLEYAPIYKVHDTEIQALINELFPSKASISAEGVITLLLDEKIDYIAVEEAFTKLKQELNNSNSFTSSQRAPAHSFNPHILPSSSASVAFVRSQPKVKTTGTASSQEQGAGAITEKESSNSNKALINGRTYWGLMNPSCPNKSPTLFFAISPTVEKQLGTTMYNRYCDLIKIGRYGSGSGIYSHHLVGRSGEPCPYKAKLARTDLRVAFASDGVVDIDGRQCELYLGKEVFGHSTPQQFRK